MPIRYMLVTLFCGVITGVSYADNQSYHTNRSPEQPLSQSSRLDEPKEAMTLQHALALALLHDPGLAAFSIEIRAKEAQTIQAGLFPNPELAAKAVDFGGENGRQEFDGVETTIWLSQLVPLGGKISKKKRVASLEKDLSVWDYESKKLDVLTFTAKAYIAVLSAQERLHLAKELNTLAQDVLETVSARVKAGKGFPVEKTRAKVTLSTSTIKLKKAQSVLEAARRNLAFLWGNYNPGFVKAEGDLYITKGIPSLNELNDKISQNPDMARWKHEIKMRKAVVKRENSNAVPDVTVSFGKRFFAEDNSDAFVMGFSMPLPVFNRNQGSRLEAKHRLSKAKRNEEAVKLQILSFLSRSYQLLSAAFIEVETLRDNVLPDAQKVFDSSSEWYRKGKFSYLQVLDAQRTLFEIREQYINALTAYHQGVNNVERLITGKIN
ncbi:MAG: TolC family protein [Candidatus Anammoxibacter sp.]